MTQRSLRSALAGRGFMLLPAAAYLVHEGRYQLAYGSRATQALAAQGHGYLDSLAPWLGLLLALWLGSLLVRVARRAVSRAGVEPTRPFAGLWLVSWVALMSIYAVQEWLEGMFASGHPGGLGGIVGHGGWWAVVLSALAALVVAAVLWFSSAAVRVVGRLASTGRPATVAGLPAVRPAPVPAVRRAPLADASAGRAPPRGGLAALA